MNGSVLKLMNSTKLYKENVITNSAVRFVVVWFVWCVWAVAVATHNINKAFVKTQKLLIIHWAMSNSEPNKTL